MIVCICRGASESDVLQAIDDGARSVRDLQRCGIGTDCGSCHRQLRHMLAASAIAREARPVEHCPVHDEVAVAPASL